MSDTTIYLLITLGLTVIVGLSIYIWKQLKVQREHQQRLAEIEQEAIRKTQERRDYLIESIRLISHAMEHDEQMTLTEGAIRLKVLVEHLAPHLLSQEPYSILVLMFEETQHIPLKEQFKALDKKAQKKFHREMRLLEAKHQDALIEAAQKLHSYPFGDQ
ncbi:MAG: DUF2489 domain-containing protein [Marinobacterium sp.]|nr:DUF2489 domain-containing protein [Marinobacterium sp.]